MANNSTYSPQIYFQLDMFYLANIVHHNLFGLPNVCFYIGGYVDMPFQPPGYPRLTGNSPSAIAWNTANWIQYTKDLVHQYHPNVKFRYALFPQGCYARSFESPTDDSLFNHEQDRFLLNGVSTIGPWHARGVAAKSVKMEEYFRALANELRSRGLPMPDFVDPDDESPYFKVDFTSDNVQNLNILKADPRFFTERVDGIVTMREYLTKFKDIDGNPSPITTALPPRFDLFNDKVVHFYLSMEARIKDYCLWQSTFRWAKKYLGTAVQCQNWISFAANRSNRSFNVRFKETPADYSGGSFRMNNQVWSNYGWDWVDSADLTPFPGCHTFEACLEKYNVIRTQPINDQISDIYVKEIGYNLAACRNAYQAKPVVFWWQWRDVSYDSVKVPPSGGQLIVTPTVAQEVFTVCEANNIQKIGIFDPSLTEEMATNYYNLFKGTPLTSGQ